MPFPAALGGAPVEHLFGAAHLVVEPLAVARRSGCIEGRFGVRRNCSAARGLPCAAARELLRSWRRLALLKGAEAASARVLACCH